MLKLLIADSTEEFRLALAEEVAGDYEVCCCRQGKEALALMGSFQPDVLVLDLMLPELDGISLLYRAQEQGMSPVVLAVCRYVNDYVQEQMARLGVGYIMMKPCDIRATAERLRDLTQQLDQAPPARPDVYTLTANILMQLSVPTKLNGYNYLRDAIPMAMRQSGQMVTKQIYPEVGRLSNVGWKQVERCIRSAINAAYRRRDEAVWRQYFPPEPDGTIARPSNGAFISRMAELLRSEMAGLHS